jgi:hypothetical protein
MEKRLVLLVLGFSLLLSACLGAVSVNDSAREGDKLATIYKDPT